MRGLQSLSPPSPYFTLISPHSSVHCSPLICSSPTKRSLRVDQDELLGRSSRKEIYRQCPNITIIFAIRVISTSFSLASKSTHSSNRAPTHFRSKRHIERVSRRRQRQHFSRHHVRILPHSFLHLALHPTMLSSVNPNVR